MIRMASAPVWSAFTCAAFAAFGFGARPAAAQTLSLVSGDRVTVTAGGTSGTYQGKPITNGTSAYALDASGGAVVSVPVGSMFRLGGGSLSIVPSLGSFGVGLSVNGGTATISGGSIRGGDYYGTGMTVSGGGIAFVTGGSFSGGAFPGDPGSSGLSADGGIIDLFGTFSRTGPVVANPTGSGVGGAFITGTLQNGQAISTYGMVANGGIIEFNVAPEPSQGAALSLGGLGLAGLVFKSWRRRQPA